MSIEQKAALIADKVMRLAFLCRQVLVVTSDDVIRDFDASEIDYMYGVMYRKEKSYD